MAEIFVLEKEEFRKFIDALISASPGSVIGVKQNGTKFAYGSLKGADELRLDFDVTIQPPKKYFLPPCEQLLSYNAIEPAYEEISDVKPVTLVGVHPYDIVAIRQMDAVFSDSRPDYTYLKRREDSVIIGVNMQNVSPHSFAASMGTALVEDGYDLMVTDIGDKYTIQIGSGKGMEILGGRGRIADVDDIAKLRHVEREILTIFTSRLDFSPKELPRILDANYDNEIWAEKAEKCLKCGTCNLVCPTCYCFDVQDVVHLNLEEGTRIRTWDGCLLEGFAEVTSGENFRRSPPERYRHRFMRKGSYMYDRFGFVACVGCGRCASQCLPDIADPVKVFNSLYAGSSSKPSTMKRKIRQPTSDYLPKIATIRKITTMTSKEKLFEISLDDGTSLGHQPGQFVQVSVAGIGEAPISITSSPTNRDCFELCIRKMGSVTSAIHQMKEENKVGIRGPFGKGFDTHFLKEKDLMFVAGGIGLAPLRSLINYVLDNRKDYGKISILYGCREPCEILFDYEIARWEGIENITHHLTVDKCAEGECWEGNIGVITTLIPKVDFDPDTTYAVVCGPPVMYKFVIKSLKEKGMADDHIIISLERRMKCGVGKCGHCQINGVYVCRDGPVFNYADIKDLPEAL